MGCISRQQISESSKDSELKRNVKNLAVGKEVWQMYDEQRNKLHSFQARERLLNWKGGCRGTLEVHWRYILEVH